MLTYHPAADFDPLTATNAELTANGLPTRPAASDYATWIAYVTSKTKHPESHCPTRQAAHREHGPGPLTSAATPPATHTHYDSRNWAGYLVNGHTYYDSDATWSVPAAGGPSNGARAYSSSWVGVGLGQTPGGALVQAGSDSNAQPTGFYDIWWEVYPETSSRLISDDVYPGNLIYARMHFVKGTAEMTVIDESSGAGGTYTYSNPIITPDGHAEWIYERTEEGSTLPLLANATTKFSGAQAGGAGVAMTNLTALPYYAAVMANCTNGPDIRLASPSLNSASSFTDQWLNFGTVTPFNDCTVWSNF
jgi:hypothetical protein